MYKRQYQIKCQLPDFGGFGADSANITTTFYLVVPDFDAAIDALQTQDTRYPVVISWQYSFDSGSPDKEQIVFPVSYTHLVLAWESVMMALVAIVGGEALGIALGKLFELVLVNIVGGSVQMRCV